MDIAPYLQKDYFVHRRAIAIFLFILTSSLWASPWTFAPATASANPDNTIVLNFQSLEGYSNLEGLIIDNEGWFWLKMQIPVDTGDDSLLLYGTSLGWTVWWNEEKLVESGSGPPWWHPSSPIPYLVSFPAETSGTVTFLMKVYLRRGYAALPGPVEIGNRDRLWRHQVVITMEQLGLPALTVLLGIILFIGGLAGYFNRKQPYDGVLALFGFFITITFLEPVLVSIPGFPPLVPWILPAIAVRAALPLALSFWRKSVSSAGGQDHTLITVIDLLLAIGLSLWLIYPLIGYPFIPERFHYFFNFDPLPWYILICFGTAFALWIYHTIAGHPGRIGSLLIFLAAAAPPVAVYFTGSPIIQIHSVFISMGLPASLLVALPVIMSRGRKIKVIPEGQLEEPEKLDNLEELEELEELDEAVQNPASINDDKRPVGNEELLARSIRSSLFPESIPWDSEWDLASARQGASHPATGFHDIYFSEGRRLAGFSFMDTGADNLESLVFSHLVRSELTRCFMPGITLPRIVRTVHRKAVSAAGAAEKTMIGVIGRFRGDKLVFLPLSLPPMLLKRQSTEIVISLLQAEGRVSNPPLGSRQFGAQGLRTLNISMSSGDTVVAYTPSILNLKSSGGGSLGLGRFAAALKASTGRKADEIVAEIIGELKDFSGSDAIPAPLQILVIKRR